MNPNSTRPNLDGPVLAPLAKESTPGIAQLDARWAARVLAGEAAELGLGADDLRQALEMTGLIAEPYRPARRVAS